MYNVHSPLCSLLSLFTREIFAYQIQLRLGVHDTTTNPSTEIRRNVLEIKQNSGYNSAGKLYKHTLKSRERDDKGRLKS